MTDPTVTDLRRELAKAREALAAAEQHLARHAEANAALHCTDRVMYSPLHAKVTAAIAGADHALARTEQPGHVHDFRSFGSDRGRVRCTYPGCTAKPTEPNAPTLDHASPDGPWAALAADLDRCQHGRHQGDACGPADDCTGTSAGNPHIRPGQVIGYGLRGDPIVMPDRYDKHDPAAWRAAPVEQP